MIYRLTLQTLEGTSGTSRQGRWLALGSSLLVTLGASVQSLATVPNGTTVAVAAALASIWLVIRLLDYVAQPSASETIASQRALVAGAMVGLTWLESPRAGLFSTLVVGLLAAVSFKAPTHARWAGALGGGIVVCALGLPFWFARRGFVAMRVETPFSSIAGQALPLRQGLGTEWTDWARIIGPFWLGVALVALFGGLFLPGRKRLRWIAISLAVALASSHFGVLRDASSRSVVYTIGAAALIAAATKGLHDAVSWVALRQPRTLGLGVTLVVLSQAVSALARHDEASFANEHYRSIGAEAWTDEALDQLPAGSVVLVRTRPILERILAAQVVDSVRPDLLIVPLERATDPSLAAALVLAEPTLLPVIRDLTINGRPSENAISALADARPLFTEFDPRWETRLREHLLVEPFFHRVYSQTLGRSDRASALPRGQRALSRLLAVTQTGDGTAEGIRLDGDRFTLRIVEARLEEQMTLLLALGDRQACDTLLTSYGAIFKDSPWAERFRARLAQHPRGGTDAFDLLNTATSVVLDVP